MKLASLKHGRDGRLVVIDRLLQRMADASHVAPTLQAALDDWAEYGPRLQALSEAVEGGACATEPFDAKRCSAPLPRAYQWLDASAYVNHVALVRKARGAAVPETFWTDPLMYQGGSDIFLAAHDPIRFPTEDWGIDFEAELAVILDDVPINPSFEQARSAIRLLLLINDISLRTIVPGELAKGFGFLQSKPSSVMSPVVVTPDELGAHWDGGRLHLPLRSWLNGKAFGQPNAGIDMTFDFPALIMHAAKTRPLVAGTVIGSGTVSNRGPDGDMGRPIGEGGAGYSCIAELRTVETLLDGHPSTPFLKSGDTIRIEMRDDREENLFGAIAQTVEICQR
jgi:fumarylacetoacetate (FAA) hydrolase